MGTILMRVPRVPVFIYHGFYRDEREIAAVPLSDRRYSLPIDRFASHLDRLSAGNFPVCSIASASGARDVVFSFDDGHISNYTWVFPMLAERGFTGEFFIVAGWVGRAGHINAAQLREMSSNGMSIGSHGLTHTPLAGLPDADLDRELRVSKDKLEQCVGCPVTTLALPRGLMDERLPRMARAAGYQRVCTSSAGLMNGGFLVPRLSITSFTPVDTVERFARRDALLLARTRLSQAARLGVKRLIGVRNYEALAQRFLGAS